MLKCKHNAILSLPEHCLRPSLLYCCYTPPDTATCSTGMRFLLLVCLGRDQDVLASGLASIAAAQHFVHHKVTGHTLTKNLTVSKAWLQRLTEVAHVCCVLKVLLDLGADAPLAFCAINSGESCHMAECT